MVECNTQLCTVALKVVGSVGTRLTPHLCNALPTDRPNLLHNILLIQNITEYNKIFQNILTLFTNHPSVLQNILPIQNITEYKKIFKNIPTLFCTEYSAHTRYYRVKLTALICYIIFCPHKVLQTKTKYFKKILFFTPPQSATKYSTMLQVLSYASHCSGLPSFNVREMLFTIV